MVLEERSNTSTIGTFDLKCGSKRSMQYVESLGLNAGNANRSSGSCVLLGVCSLYQHQVPIFELDIVWAELHINSYGRIVGWKGIAIYEELVGKRFCHRIGQDVFRNVGITTEVIVDAVCVLFARCKTPSTWTLGGYTACLDKVKDGEESVK